MARKLNCQRISGPFFFVISMRSRCSHIVVPLAIYPKQFGPLDGLLYCIYMLRGGRRQSGNRGRFLTRFLLVFLGCFDAFKV